MAAPTRVPASNISVFTLNGQSLLTSFKSGTVHIEVKTEDGSGAVEAWEYPIPVKYKWHIEVDLFAEEIAALMPLVGESLPVVYQTGAGTYSGQVLITPVSHEVKDGSLEMNKGTLHGQGQPVLN